MLTLEEATQAPGVCLYGLGLSMHFDSLPNWYGCILGFACPRCDQRITWRWEGKLPDITTPASIDAAGVHPVVTEGAEMLGWGHRYMDLRCTGCGVELYAENFDRPRQGPP